VSHDVGWSLTAGAPVTHRHQCVPTLFLWIFFVRLLLLEPYDCTLCQREDITSWPHFSLRTLTITYFFVTTRIYFFDILIAELLVFNAIYTCTNWPLNCTGKNTIRVSKVLLQYIHIIKGRITFFSKFPILALYKFVLLVRIEYILRLIPNELYFRPSVRHNGLSLRFPPLSAVPGSHPCSTVRLFSPLRCEILTLLRLH